MKIEILYQDPQLVLVNKPAGFAVHATVDPLRPHVQGMLEKQLGEKLVLHHRLDADTSGVLCFARDPSVNKALTEMFRDRKVEKVYWAWVEGRWLPDWHEVQTYIKKVPGGRWANVAKGRGGAWAKTLFRVIEDHAEYTWIEARPETGRTHQIRLHCLAKNHPIVGDKTYGRPDKKGRPMFLHARSLSFQHPITQEKLHIQAPVSW